MTHWHHDHVGGMPYILRMLEKLRAKDPRVPKPRIHKFAEGKTDSTFFDRVSDVDSEAYEPNPESMGLEAVLWPLRDIQTITVSDPEDQNSISSVRAVFTPGHAADHASLLLEEDNILLTGDNVLGRGSTVFEDLVMYLRSLQRSLALMSIRRPTLPGIYGTPLAGNAGENVLYPGHGPVVPKGRDTLQRYIKHRLEREEQILALLLGTPGNKAFSTEAMAFPEKILDLYKHSKQPRHPWTLHQLIEVLYADYDTKMYPTVANGLFMHLRKLSKTLEELTNAPFYIADPLPTTPWTRNGRLVRCTRLPSYQYTTESIPDAARNEQEWWELMSVPWILAL
ncbi:hypothetical protein MYAM1_001583 [Malassezia yamatoensis]|uniref:Metallo-beta-lactamase domain-containing protein n=1 Tax=Malassezia yamatoensis TaxID=253288 RepID=A0AAJ5YRL3_9BASI|nr:hypothetical protein MYAM1_001583 [Malassezia yamatoensis]